MQISLVSRRQVISALKFEFDPLSSIFLFHSKIEAIVLKEVRAIFPENWLHSMIHSAH